MNNILLYTYTKDTPLETLMVSNRFDFDVLLNDHSLKFAVSMEQYNLCIIHTPTFDNVLALVNSVRSYDAKIFIIVVCDTMFDANTAIGILNMGADDVICMPYDLAFVIATIKARYGRIEKHVALKTEYKIGRYTLNAETKELRFDDEEPMQLSYKESCILQYLCHFKGTVTPRSLILKSIWHEDNYYNSRSLDVFMVKLRKKLSRDKRIIILSEKGRGYCLIVD